ncbi:MAG: hypothetical protein ACI37T_08535 [Candidatus Gastranaerophilaceae bacterium]
MQICKIKTVVVAFLFVTCILWLINTSNGICNIVGLNDSWGHNSKKAY